MKKDSEEKATPTLVERLRAEAERLFEEGTAGSVQLIIDAADTITDLLAVLEQIVRGEEEAPVGMSNPAALARQALIRIHESNEGGWVELTDDEARAIGATPVGESSNEEAK